jgi:integrase/recombinase XerD
MSEMRLTDTAGNRLYLNAEERAAFLAAARRQPARDRTLCETLHYTGCRPSELLEITPARIDLSGGTITIRSLKKRKDASGRSKIVYRSVPVPPEYLDTLNTAHGIREAQKSRKQASAPIWALSRVRVWQIVKRIMIEADIPDAPHRSPKGLRHGFGINAAAANSVLIISFLFIYLSSIKYKNPASTNQSASTTEILSLVQLSISCW